MEKLRLIARQGALTLLAFIILLNPVYSQESDPAPEAAAVDNAAGDEAEETKEDKKAKKARLEEEEEIAEAPLEYTPLEMMEPLALPEAVVTNKTSVTYGMVATNTFYTATSDDYSTFIGYYRPYVKGLFEEKHQAVMRLNLAATSYLGDTALAPTGEFVPRIELFYFNFLINFNNNVTVGRQFLKLGKGILFSNYADGLSFKNRYGRSITNAFVAFSGEYGDGACFINMQGCGDAVVNPYNVIPGIAPDATTGWDASGIGRRLFVGVDWNIAIIPGSELYASLLYSNDMLKEAEGVPYRLEYNPVYLALGSKGYIVIPDLRYHLEGIAESGSTYNLQETAPSRIFATAFLLDLAYAIPLQDARYKPNVIFQFAAASGDEDKMSVVLPSGTNIKKADSAFYYFGNYSGGMGFKPFLSNMMVVRAGFSVRPAASWYPGRDLSLLVKYSYYTKRVAEGVVSDQRVISTYTSGVTQSELQDNKTLGHGVDMTMVWRVKTDLNFYYNMGFFKPGNAFPVEEQVNDIVHLVSATLMF